MIQIHKGDSRIVLKEYPDNYFDSLITDPPAAISLMNKTWDSNKGGRDQWITWLSEILKEVYRVLKPGAYGVIWAIPRTSHYTAFAAENAGFEIRDIIHHLFGSGYPTGLNISKQFDREAGKGIKVKTKGGRGTNSTMYNPFSSGEMRGEFEELLPETDNAKEWLGWHTKLKPATEHWILIQKPTKLSITQNILEFGTGGLHIEATRVPANDGFEKAWDKPVSTNVGADGYVLLTNAQHTVDLSEHKPSGRFPANLVFSHHPDCRLIVASGGPYGTSDWCHEDCPVKQIDAQTGYSKARRSQRGKTKVFNQYHDQWEGESTERGFNDEGGKARYFTQLEGTFGYHARVSPSEKRFYCKDCDAIYVGTKNNFQEHKAHGIVAHPTPKSIKLMQWLITLITPTNGRVLDPFFGTGSTGVACQELGFDCTGIDLDDEDGYLKIAQARIEEKVA
jgi:DNA modification methylase